MYNVRYRCTEVHYHCTDVHYRGTDVQDIYTNDKYTLYCVHMNNFAVQMYIFTLKTYTVFGCMFSIIVQMYTNHV